MDRAGRWLYPLVPRALLALAIGAFGIGTTEFVVMGMLPEIADGLDVSVSAVGLLISAYAIVYFKFPFRLLAFWMIFITLMLPLEVRIVPQIAATK